MSAAARAGLRLKKYLAKAATYSFDPPRSERGCRCFTNDDTTYDALDDARYLPHTNTTHRHTEAQHERGNKAVSSQRTRHSHRHSAPGAQHYHLRTHSGQREQRGGEVGWSALCTQTATARRPGVDVW